MESFLPCVTTKLVATFASTHIGCKAGVVEADTALYT